MGTTIQIEIPAAPPGATADHGRDATVQRHWAGRRWGKNVLALHRLSEPALEGHPVAFFAPTYKTLAETWRDFKRVLAPAIERSSEQEKRIELKTGGVIEFWTLEDENAGRSRKYKHIVVDEAAHIPNLEAAYNGAIRPTLTDLEGSADFYSTPKGRGYFYRAWCRGQDAEQPAWASWTFPSSANPFLPAAELEEARKQLPERVYNQEYLAKFIDDAGGVFKAVQAAVDIGRTNEVMAAELVEKHAELVRGGFYVRDPMTYTAGLDLARFNDFTAISVLDSTCRQVWFDRWNQTTWERQISSIVDIAQKFRPVFYCDSTGIGQPVFERLRSMGLTIFPFTFTNQSKEQLINNLASMIEQGKIRLMDIPVQTGELINYEYDLSPSGKLTMSAPSGENDDTVIALALGAWGASGSGFYSAGCF